MTNSTSMWTMFGTGYSRVQKHFGVGFYRKQTEQKWSPLMQEINVERGLKFGSWQFGISRTYKRFIDFKTGAISIEV